MEAKEVQEKKHECNCASGGFISERDAIRMIKRYRKSPAFYLNSKVKGHFFGRDMIEKILSMEDAVGLRIYYGYKKEDDDSQTPELLMVSVNSEGNDMSEEGVVDESLPCPRICPDKGLGSH